MITTSRIDNCFRIAIFLSRYAFATTPCTLYTARLLARAGYEVDIFCYQPFDDPAKVRIPEANIHVHDLTAPGAPAQGDIPDPVVARAAAIMGGRRYVCFMGMEAQGLIFAGPLAERFETPLIYYSAELYYTGHPHMDPAEMARIKPRERMYHARCAATIIQDEERARILAEDNRVAMEKVFYVPVGMLGERIEEKGRYFHRMFSLPDTERVLLQFGAIHPRRQSDRIAKMSADLPDGWTLVMHGFVDRKIHDTVLAMADPSKVRLSRTLVALDDLPQVVASADVGLVFYTDDNLNDYNTGLASDKMARHMQCGTPVITCDFPGFRKVLHRYGCGAAVADPADIPRALAGIAADYDRFAKGARRAYGACYRYDSRFKPVLDYLYEISTLPPETKHRAIEAHADRYGPRIFVETGTFMGDTVQAVREKFSRLYSIELSASLFKKAQARFAGDSRIVLACGDSAKTLPKLLAHIHEPALFWLDGHYSGGVTAKGEKSTPVEEELRSIFAHPVPGHVILIDDARDFNGSDDYPSLETLARWVDRAPGRWRFQVEDGIIAILPDPENRENALPGDPPRPRIEKEDHGLEILSRAAALMGQGKFEDAERLFQDLLAADPGDVEAMFGLAGAQWKQGRSQEAPRTLKKVLLTAPDDRHTVWNLGRMLAAMGRIPDACRVYGKYLQEQGRDPEMSAALARWRGAGAWEESAAEAARHDPAVPAAPAECIVFSMDRALQLHALLSSYFDRVVHPVPVHLFYRTSTSAHQRAYDQLIDGFSGRLASVTVQDPFRARLLALLEAIKAPKMFFLVDDDLFIQKTDMADFTRFDTDRFVPSLRMAPHLTRCYTLDKDQPLPRFLTGVLPDADKVCWRWADGVFDWRYPLSIDGHLFSTHEMRKMAGRIDFVAPNSFEAGLQAFLGDFIHRIGVGYRQSKIVNIPCNMVQVEWENLHGSLHQDDLLEKFNQGLRIDFARLYGITNNGAHQDLPLDFIRPPATVCARAS